MFLVHPTRLSKIFAASRTHPCGNARQRQASKLVSHARAKARMHSPKLKSFEKNLPGRPYSAPAVARLEFCYHSLQEDQYLCITLRARKQIRAANRSPSSKSATSLEYQNHYRRASPVRKYFREAGHLHLSFEVLPCIINGLTAKEIAIACINNL
jgi:hypothetical protein